MDWLVFTPQQVQLFAYSCVFGAMLAVLYDVFRILRLIFFKDSFTVLLQDILFWIIAGFSTFLFFLALNYGHIRLYLLLGMLIGAALYYVTLGRLIFLFVKRVCNEIRRALKWVWSKTGGKLIKTCRELFKKGRSRYSQMKKTVRKKSKKNKKTS